MGKSCNKGKNNGMYKVHRFGKDAPNFINGNCSIRKYYCIKCGKEIGYNSWHYGLKICKKCNGERLKILYKGKNNPNYGGTFHGTRGSCRGKYNSRFIDGRTPLNRNIYNSEKYKQWREKVYKKANYICQICFKKPKRLEAHHIKKFDDIFCMFLKVYSKLSPIKDREKLLELADKYNPFWDVNNGQALCRPCHLKVHPRERNKNGTFK